MVKLPPVPDDADEFDSQGINQARIEPVYFSDSSDEPSPVWAVSQLLRALIDKLLHGYSPTDEERRGLLEAILRQLPSLGLYHEVSILRMAPAKEITISRTISLYVLLFPGEGKDNTGIKDLNDKVLNYELNTEWMALRQKAVAEVFWQTDPALPSRWITVGQDYKTAYVVPLNKTRKDFANDLVTFDAKLRDYLLIILKKAEKTINDPEKLTEIRKLRKTLEQNEKYKFDFLFGFASIQPGSDKTIDVVFRLITEALKGGAIAKFAAKRDSLTTGGEAKKIATGKGVKSPPKDEDSRGQTFDINVYLRASGAADDTKSKVSEPYSRDKPRDYNSIFVNTVWIVAFLVYRRKYWGNPDMVRDVRKKALVQPTKREGLKYAVNATRELLELWLVALNMLDFVAGFLSAEFHRELVSYHDLALDAFAQLQDKTAPIDVDRLVKVLTRDLRQLAPRPILGTTSEFQFYAYSSDYADQIFFVMDIRDLGVDLMAIYEIANEIITDDKLQGNALMDMTFRAGDPIVARKRLTYDSVVAVFWNYFRSLPLASGRSAAERAFGTGLQSTGSIPDFDKSLQVMLGGDEIFVAAHPYYAKFESQIIRDLSLVTYDTLPLNLRTGVVYSSAKRAPGSSGSAGVSDAQRRENQIAHDKALRLVSASHGFLKSLERTHRRIELLINKLDTSKDKQKQKLAPLYTEKLANLHLTEVYARSKYGHAKQLSDATYTRLLRMLRTGDITGAEDTGLFDLVDLNGNKVVGEKLVDDAKKLEADVRKDVGVENYHVEGPLVTQMPKRLKKEIDDWADRKGRWKDWDKKP